jgi:hypothetical protein
VLAALIITPMASSVWPLHASLDRGEAQILVRAAVVPDARFASACLPSAGEPDERSYLG